MCGWVSVPWLQVELVCENVFFFLCGFVCRKPIRFDLKNLNLGNMLSQCAKYPIV